MPDDRKKHGSKAQAPSYLRSNGPALDGVDAAILRELGADARLPRAELARRVGLSAPSTGERVRRLEEAGVILGYGARIDPARLGRPLAVLIRARPSPGEMGRMVEAIRATPQIVSCERVSGEDCFVARAHVADPLELEAVIDRLVPFGATNTALVQSTPVEPRMAPLPDEP